MGPAPRPTPLRPPSASRSAPTSRPSIGSSTSCTRTGRGRACRLPASSTATRQRSGCRAAASALTEFAAASPVSFEWFDPTAMAGWLATLTKQQLAALFGDKDVAEGWWASLSEDQRIAFVAGQLDGIEGVIGEVVEEVEGPARQRRIACPLHAVAMAEAGDRPATVGPDEGLRRQRGDGARGLRLLRRSSLPPDPEKFWWAGMASMIGPSFVAGMADLSDTGAMLQVYRAARRGGQPPAGDTRLDRRRRRPQCQGARRGVEVLRGHAALDAEGDLPRHGRRPRGLPRRRDGRHRAALRR